MSVDRLAEDLHLLPGIPNLFNSADWSMFFSRKTNSVQKYKCRKFASNYRSNSYMKPFNNDDIDRFSLFFYNRVEDASLIHIGEYDHIYKKLILVSVLDSLARTIYPQRKNRERFIYFIVNFSDWSDGDRISLPHLVRLLDKSPEPEFSELRKYAHSLYSKWHDGSVPNLAEDPDYNSIRSRWPKDKDLMKLLDNTSIDSLKHYSLLYFYRSCLVHELRKPGYGFESGIDTPHYHSSTDSVFDTDSLRWELVYPTKFFINMCKTCISNAKLYYNENKINPYNYFTFGTYWISELNS